MKQKINKIFKKKIKLCNVLNTGPGAQKICNEHTLPAALWPQTLSFFAELLIPLNSHLASPAERYTTLHAF